MSEILNEDQIRERYPSEWVIVGDLETDEQLHVKAGVVRFHSPDPDEVDRVLLDVPDKRVAVIYTGTGPEHIALNL